MRPSPVTYIGVPQYSRMNSGPSPDLPLEAAGAGTHLG
jgi:hypothetical protein